MKILASLAALTIALPCVAIAADKEGIELEGNFKAIPKNTQSCGVLFVGTNVTFIDKATNKEFPLVISCLDDLTVKNQSGKDERIAANRTYLIKASPKQPKGLCCFSNSPNLLYLDHIQEKH